MIYDTLTEAIADLQKKGYTEDLSLKSNCIECKAFDYRIYTNQFEIDEMHRFEGDSNPDTHQFYLLYLRTHLQVERTINRRLRGVCRSFNK